MKERYMGYLNQAGSENEEMVVLMREIENLANTSGISVTDIKFSGKNIQVKPLPKYMVNVSCEGSMESLINFMHNIENSKRLLSIEKYQISPKSSKSSDVQVSLVVSEAVIE